MVVVFATVTADKQFEFEDEKKVFIEKKNEKSCWAPLDSSHLTLPTFSFQFKKQTFYISLPKKQCDQMRG